MRSALRYRWLVITPILFAIGAVNFADRGVLGVVAPKLIHIFGLSAGDIGFISSAFGFGYVFIQLFVSGSIVRRLGPHSVISFFAILWSIFLALTTVAVSATTFFLYRLLFGLSEGPNWPAMEAIISRWFPSTETQRAFNFSWVGIPMGSIFGPPLAVALVGAFDWRAPFYVLAGIGILLTIVFYIFVTNDPSSSRFLRQTERDEIVRNRPARATDGDAYTVATRAYRWRQLLTSKSLWLGAFSSWSTAYIIYLQLAFFPLYITTVRHIDFKAIGWLVALPYVAALLGGVSMGSVADKLYATGHRYASRTGIPGMLGIVAGATLVGAAFASDLPLAIFFFAVSAFCQQASNGVINATAIDICPEEPHLATQMIVGGGSSAAIIAPLVSGVLVTATGSYLPAFILAGALPIVIGSLVLLWFRPRPLPVYKDQGDATSPAHSPT